jgi:hypothetical protein
MIIADQNDVSLLQQCVKLARLQNEIVGAESLAEVEQVLAPADAIGGADCALDPGNRM